MNRDEFEKAYAEKYLEGDYIVARDNREGEGYTDHHIDIWWKIWKIQGLPAWERSLAIIDLEM